MPQPTLSVGTLARRAGLSVRTLHHYDAIGLVSERTGAGHRRYAPADVARVQQVVSLRAVGLPLTAIRDALDRPDADPLAAVEQHIAHLRAGIARQQQLLDRLDTVARHVRAAGPPDVDILLTLLHWGRRGRRANVRRASGPSCGGS